MKFGWPDKCSKTEETGREVQGRKREPCNFEASKTMIFSRVVKSRFEMGSSSSSTLFPISLTELCPFSFGPRSGEVKEVVVPVMARIRYHCTLGHVD